MGEAITDTTTDTDTRYILGRLKRLTGQSDNDPDETKADDSAVNAQTSSLEVEEEKKTEQGERFQPFSLKEYYKEIPNSDTAVAFKRQQAANQLEIQLYQKVFNGGSTLEEAEENLRRLTQRVYQLHDFKFNERPVAARMLLKTIKEYCRSEVFQDKGYKLLFDTIIEKVENYIDATYPETLEQ